MIVVLKKRVLWITLVCLLVVALGLGGGLALATRARPAGEKVVVLDPGHGGVDGGVVGVNSRVSEAEINLMLALRLGELLTAQGFRVIYTRSDGGGLYPEDAENKKRADMLARKDVILAAKPDLMLSIHCNNYPSPTRRGAQVFFESTSPAGQALAVCVQDALNSVNRACVGRSFTALKGDYYMLKCSPYPSAIAECGFLSNPEDDALLNSAEHRETLAYCLFSGILSYFSTRE